MQCQLFSKLEAIQATLFYTWYHNAKLPQAGDSLTIIFKLL